MLKKQLSLAISLLSLVGAASHADFINGGFEDIAGSLTGWTVKEGKVKNSPSLPEGQHNIDWCTEDGNSLSPRASVCESFSFLNPHAQAVDETFHDHYIPDFNTILQGDWKALLNWQPSGNRIIGGRHATQLSQDARFAPADLGADGKLNIYVLWGALLENPAGHAIHQQPFFEINIERGDPDGLGGLTWSTISNEFKASGPGDADWDENMLSGSLPSYSRSATDGFSIDINPAPGEGTPLTLGTDGLFEQVFRIELTVADCSAGAHGGYAWLDYIGTQCTPQHLQGTSEDNGVPCPEDEPKYCVLANDEVYIKDFATINNSHVAGGTFFEMGFGSALNGKASVNGDVRLMEQSVLTGDLTYSGSLFEQPNTTVTGNIVSNTSTPNILIPTRTVNIGTASAEASQSGNCHITLPPGDYFNVWVRQNCSLTLNSGTYNVRELIFDSGAQFNIDATAAAPVNINTDHIFRLGDGVVMSNVNGDIAPEQVNLYTNQSGWMHFGGAGGFFGTLTAPNANLSVFQNGEFNGCLQGLNVFVEPRAVINGIDTSSGGGNTQNLPPNAVINAPSSVAAGTAVTLDGTASSDPEGSALTYVWTINGNNSGTSATLDHNFTSAGTYTIGLTVTDAQGASKSSTSSITVTATGSCTSIDLGGQNATVIASGNQCFSINASQLPGDQWWHPGSVVLSIEPNDGQVLTGSTSFDGNNSLNGWSQSLSTTYPWPKADINFTIDMPTGRSYKVKWYAQ